MKKIAFLLSILFFINNAFANPNQISNDIDIALKNLAYSGRHEFNVDVKNNVVKISGFVSSNEDRKRVENAVLKVPGVKVLENHLTVLKGGNAVSNNETVKKIRDRIKADSALRNYNLNIEQNKEIVVLSGEVENATDKERIFNIAYNVVPTATIQNKLRVKVVPTEPDSFINQKVLETLKAENVKGLDGVLINTQDGIVTFSGQVKNHKELDRMLSLTLMVEGVKSVRSEVKTK